MKQLTISPLHLLRGLTGPSARYSLDVPTDARRRLAIGWLSLALASLIASGIFSVLLVLSRAPYVKDVFPLVDFFHVALVVHVDLSVLVWFLAFAGMLWSLNSTPRLISMAWLALLLALLGTAVMSLAPFLGRGGPVMSNYVPVLDEPVFLAGLLAFAAGMALLLLRAMIAIPRVGTRLDGAAALRFGLNSSAVAAAVAVLAFVWSYAALPSALDGKAYYEMLFWGGGHVLQFAYTLLLFVAWLWLCDGIGRAVPLSPRVATLLFGVGLAAVFATPIIYLAYPVGSVEHHRWLTWLMRFGGGLAIVPFALAISVAALRNMALSANQAPLRAALLSSIALFGAGGLIGVMIDGNNVKIPAHYHGSIVGITLAFMGLTYQLLPRLGLGTPRPGPARWQPWIYGGGQLLHIIGLMWSGGYGVQRKVAGAAQALRSPEEILGMGLMGLGGLIAVIGGLMFLLVVLQAIGASRRANAP